MIETQTGTPSTILATRGRALLSAIVAAGIVAATAGCGGNPTTPDTATTAILQADTLAVTRAAAAHNTSAARTALATLRHDVTAAAAAGRISTAAAQRLLSDIAAITADLNTLASEPPSTPSGSPTGTKPPPPTSTGKPGKGDKHKHKPDHGEGGKHD